MTPLVLAGLIALAAPVAGATPSPGVAIRTLLHDQAEAWNRGDLPAFCAVYADDATFISPSGLTRGRQAVLDRYQKKYVDRAGMGSLTLEVLEVRALDAGSASLVARWTLTWPDKPKAEGLTLLVFTKTKAGWRILQDASM
jgi:uncharacterized protein (TIGR02246 family)